MTGQGRGLLHGSLVLAALLAAVAASWQVPVPVVIPEATPVGHQAGAGTNPTPPALAVPVPTNPTTALEQARRLLASGSPAEAAQLLANALGAPDPAHRLEARLLLARAILERGDAHVALELAVEAAQRAPDQRAAGIAAVLAARALATLGEHEQASEQLRVAVRLLPELAPYLEYRWLDVLASTRRETEAEQLVDQIVTTAPIRRLAVAALEWRRMRAEQRGDFLAVRETITRLLELATIPSYRATLLVQRARAARKLGDVSAAQADLLMALEIAPESTAAVHALDELDALGAGSVVPTERRAAIAFVAGRYTNAIAGYSAVLDADPVRADAWYQRAIARVRSGDVVTGVQELVAMSDRYPQDARTPDALVTAGTLVEWDDEARAEELYRRVLAQYPGTTAAGVARFRLGLLAYGRGDIESAAVLWEDLAGGSDARTSFWYGKALAARGDLASAQQVWQRVLQSEPQTFYGQRARELLHGESPLAKMPEQLSPLQPNDRPLTIWLASLGVTNETAAQRIQASSAARRALLLLDLGEREAAGWEVDVAAEELRDDPIALAAFGWELLRYGEAAYAYRIGLRLASGTEVPRTVLAPLLAPVPYPELLVPVSMRFGVDPLLLAALIRQESTFEPTAVSPAGARGLTQVMPDTGAALAAELGLARWSPDDLFRPATSILLGAAGLARRLEQFHGQLYLVLASYNAGAGAVQQWLRERPTSDPDLFVERIPYRETYAYVQRVYTGYRAYQELYGMTDE